MSGFGTPWREAGRQFVEQYGTLYHSPSTVAKVEIIFRTFGRYLDRLGIVSTGAVARDVADGYRRSRLEEGRSPWTINGESAYLRCFCRWAISRGLMELDPFQGMRRLRVMRKLDNQIVTPEQVREVLRFIGSSPFRYFQTVGDLVRLVANTGLRLSEALMLRGLDVELDPPRLWIRCRSDWQPKDSEDRIVPLNRIARAVLSRRKKAAGRYGLLFSSSLGTALSRRNVLRDFQKIGRAAGVGPVTFKGLRHLFATVNASKMSERSLAAIMGHSHPSTTDAYYVHHRMMSLPTPPTIG
jgi:integrase